eukprot:TRINITY_DN4605_c0_g3_i3.p1 TRINITY_DN4605_c0_g3~~TRINITY_DN4605_c0_g3_i3.p1  ORF type:complete len:100 (+),score=2.27 TRINITY_DN4605_c0_g3_i3:384-683(+)
MLVVGLLTFTKVALWIYLILNNLMIFLTSGANWFTPLILMIKATLGSAGMKNWSPCLAVLLFSINYLSAASYSAAYYSALFTYSAFFYLFKAYLSFLAY